MLAIKCSGIIKTFSTGEVETVALRGVDLEVSKGEFLMIVGPSGCGKTTLISIIAGILHQDFGKCEVEGHHYENMSTNDLMEFRAKNLGFIFQSFNLIPTLSIAQNVAVPLMINGMPHDKAVKVAEQILVEVQLKDKMQSRPTQLSGGQQQRVAIARALVHQPSLLICDEPTSALDHATGTKILEIMRHINKKFKTTLVVVTHDSRIFQYADRIAYMDDGRIERIETNYE
ncbi:MAG: ABC transporter ATP-binding protein [Alphaproteobacteria bacterium]|jgi:putative ABC transport system ATP-binding protein|nr:ABC transporter ATP-binding protein [Alphaproteobacteria bacterium]